MVKRKNNKRKKDDEESSSDDEYLPPVTRSSSLDTDSSDDGDDDDDDDNSDSDDDNDSDDGSSKTILKKKKSELKKKRRVTMKHPVGKRNILDMIENSILDAVTKHEKCSRRKSVRLLSKRPSVPLCKRKRSQLPNSLLPVPPFNPKDLTELIKLAKICEKKVFKDCQQLPRILAPLVQLQTMIGLSGLKQQVFHFVKNRLQRKSLKMPEMNHCILYGKPGTGKTTFAHILAKILAGLGEIATDKVVVAKNTQLIGRYLGASAIQTEEVIKSSFGGVLLLDEMTALSDGRSDGSGDSFSKSSLDTLNRYLSEDADKFTCIIAGYEDDMQRDIFSVNQGLKSRFPSVFRLDPYKPVELQAMALQVIKTKKQLQLGPKVKFDANRFKTKDFPFSGRDIQTLVDKIGSRHSDRVFGQEKKDELFQVDIDNGFEDFLKLRKPKQEDLSKLAMYC